MARYNPQVSLEETEIDANKNNPVLNPDDTGSDPKRKDENFDLELPEDITKDSSPAPEKAEVVDVKAEAFIGEQKAEGDNLVKSNEEIHLGILALEEIHLHLSNALSTTAKITPTTAKLLQASVESIDRAMGIDASAMPSLESFKTPGLAYSSSQLSLEGVNERISNALERFGQNINRLGSNLVGLAKSMTPLIDGQLARAQKLKNRLNDAHRDAGQKEIRGGFVTALSVDGRSPDASTVLKTAKYLDQCLGEILSPKGMDQAGSYIENGCKAFASGVNKMLTQKEDQHVSAWWGFIIHPAFVQLFAGGRALKLIKVDTAVTPAFFNLYPSVAKVSHSFDRGRVDNILDTKRSLPLFGNKCLAVSQYKKEVEVGAARHAVPKLTLISYGEGRGGDTMQAFKPQEQKQALDLAIKMLLIARDYYKDYATRNKRAMDVYMRNFRLIYDMWDNNSGFGHLSKTNMVGASADIMRWYARIYWQGLFKEQGTIANYARKVASSMITAVEHSSMGAQGSAPSTENLDVDPAFDHSFM